VPLVRHRFSLGVMVLMIEGLLVAAGGQRCIAAVLRLVARWLPGVPEAPCANTGRMWLLRLGLYELNREKPGVPRQIVSDGGTDLAKAIEQFQEKHPEVARYMNLGPLVGWGCRTLAFLDHPHDLPDQPVDRHLLQGSPDGPA